jgi:hypothetical protein
LHRQWWHLSHDAFHAVKLLHNVLHAVSVLHQQLHILRHLEGSHVCLELIEKRVVPLQQLHDSCFGHCIAGRNIFAGGLLCAAWAAFVALAGAIF